MMEPRRALKTEATSRMMRLGGLVQPHGAAEDFADGVEEVDLFEAVGQLIGDLHRAPLGDVQHRHDREDLAEPGFGIRAADQDEPEAARVGDRRHPACALGGRHRTLDRREWWAPVRVRGDPATGGAPVVAPDSKSAAGQAPELFQDGKEPRYLRRSVKQMEFPLGLKRTSSTRLRMRKRPAAAGFIEIVGAGGIRHVRRDRTRRPRR